MRTSQSSTGKIIVWALLLAAALLCSFWKWTYDKWIGEARTQFEIKSYAIEKKVLEELDIFTSSKVNYFINTRRFTFDPVKGMVRHFPIGEIEIMLDFPQAQWDRFMKQGGGKIHESRDYQEIRNRVIKEYEVAFEQPELAKIIPTLPGILYQIKSAPENRSREEMMKAFKAGARG